MVATTLTTTTFNNPPKAVHAGINSVSGNFNATSTQIGTLGDTIFLCKIPHGAIIVDFVEDHSTGATTAIYSTGLTTGGAPGGGASLSAFIAAGVQATVNRRSVVGGMPYQVSVSDLDPNRYGILSMTSASGSTATTSLIINWSVLYRTDGLF